MCVYVYVYVYVYVCVCVQRKKLQFQEEDKIKALRKKNSELSASVKELDDRMKLLKTENDQLVSHPRCGMWIGSVRVLVY